MADINSINRKLSHNLVGLYAFDLVARNGNFTGAAESLGLTQSAMSQRIRALETELGIVLFKREHRGVSLTNEGVRLMKTIRPSMTQMEQAVSRLQVQKSKPRVRISADFSFATFWLLPRLAHLRSELGDEIEIQILASQSPQQVNGDDCDIAIHVGPLGKMMANDILLLKERVTPVCSPKYLEQHGSALEPHDLLQHQLLSLSKPEQAQWQTWHDWFNAMDVKGEREQNYVSFNNYDMVTQSAMAGHGVALGWLGLIDQVVENGLLVKMMDRVVESEAGHIMSRDYTNSSTGPKRVFEWIADQVKAN